MAISLNNHESRIKALEGKASPKWKPIWHASWTPGVGGNDTAVNLGESYMKYDMLLFESAGWGFTHVMTACSLFTQTSDEAYIYSLYDSGNNTNYIKIIPTADYTKIKIRAIGNCRLNYIFALKLYYNFSYNICSLANSISFHFFKCLINSFKGGVKEIWRLV